MLRILFFLSGFLLTLSCGGSGSNSSVQGWHFQGRNCLACHNVDLKPEKNLLVGGTIFKALNVQNPDNLSEICTGPVYIQFLDQNYNVVYDSRNYVAQGSKGYKGKGNFFILKRLLNYLSGSYYVRLIDEKGNTLAQSLTLHTFTDIESYKPREKPVDYTNRFSCNTCHTYPDPQGGAPGFIYPNAKPCE